MTIDEASRKNIRIVHCEPWNHYAHMHIPGSKDGVIQGIWGHIVDPCGNLAMDKPASYRIEILLLGAAKGLQWNACDPREEECTEWIEPPDYRERFGEP